MGTRKNTAVTWLSQPATSNVDLLQVDDVVLRKGEPTTDLTEEQLARLRAANPGCRFRVGDSDDPDKKEA